MIYSNQSLCSQNMNFGMRVTPTLKFYKGQATKIHIVVLSDVRQ